MKIYYLSATGNSLAAARSLARELDENITLVSFRSIRLLPEIETSDTAVGFVFPVYFADVPREFLACIRKMKFRQNTYLFAIATCNGVPGTTLRTLSGALEQKGAHLSAAFSLDMPGNALITPQAASDKRLVCPASNIIISNNRPRWDSNCIHCLACFHWCPKQAIHIGGLLSDRPRYHHPEVSLSDLC